MKRSKRSKLQQVRHSRAKRKSKGVKRHQTGEVLVAVMHASPFKEIDIEAKRQRLPVRVVKL